MADVLIVYDDEDCDRRGPALKHVQSGATGRCPFCMRICYAARSRMPAVDIEARLRGQQIPAPPSEETPGEEDIRQYPNLHEPKMATGKPDGPPWGRGRSWRGDGGLSPRDKARLGDVAHRTRNIER